MRHGPSVLSILLACTPGDPHLADASSALSPATTPPDPLTTSDPSTTQPTTTTTSDPSTSSTTLEPPDLPPDPACAIAGHPGECLDLTTCPADATPFMTACAGPPAVQCCVPVAPPCSVDGAPGLCIPTSDCAAPNSPTPGRCPGDATIQCCTDPATACNPDVRPRPNDDLSEQPGDPGCPPGMARITTFCIDRFEAALLELDETGTPIAGWSPYHNPGNTRVRAVSLAHAVPQAYITQVQAAAACTESGKRLCSDAEWLRACQGPETTTYPYGHTIKPGACNDARATHPAIEYFGTSADWIWSELGHPCIAQLPAGLALTAQHLECIAAEGPLDMMGNLHEWTADPAGTFRGGFYVDTVLNGPGCLYKTTAHDVHHWDYSTGFRCCADAA